MATTKKMKYRVIAAYQGKVRLENGYGSTVLDARTPQDVLAKLYTTGAGKGFIEPVADVSAAQPQNDAKAGQ